MKEKCNHSNIILTALLASCNLLAENEILHNLNVKRKSISKKKCNQTKMKERKQIYFDFCWMNFFFSFFLLIQDAIKVNSTDFHLKFLKSLWRKKMAKQKRHTAYLNQLYPDGMA